MILLIWFGTLISSLGKSDRTFQDFFIGLFQVGISQFLFFFYTYTEKDYLEYTCKERLSTSAVATGTVMVVLGAVAGSGYMCIGAAITCIVLLVLYQQK